jgi:formylmethanofuran dehydrogenase subunit A
LKQKGHLGPGADADITIYSRDADVAKMFAMPRYVIKGGALMVEEGQLRRAPRGHRLRLKPTYDDAVLTDVRKHFETYSTIAFENYPVQGIADEPLRL